MSRRVPPQGVNLFQSIYALVDGYRRDTGQEPLNLSLGNPDGVPPADIRRLQARFAEDAGYDFHTYAEAKNLLGFAQAMVELHAGVRVQDYPHLAALPIAGIKTATAMIPLACGLADRRGGAKPFRFASTLPAYDVIGAWGGYLGARRVVWPLLSQDGMRPRLARLKAALKKSGSQKLDLIFLIRPGNPASVAATRAEWQELIRYCLKNRVRLVNDAAYVGLAGPEHVSLARAAAKFPELEWLELYSVSKSFSDPGARLGALAGSKDFVEDFLVIKGNTDSGPVPSVMAAYGEFFSNRARAAKTLSRLRALYRARVAYLVKQFKAAGLKPACGADAGFFTLWKIPRRAFGRDMSAYARGQGFSPARAFNSLAIAEAGIVGVHFDAAPRSGAFEPFIRYAACADVLSPAFQKRFEAGLARLKPAY
ncbi:MAG TPA: pyridoxal phosphate-dependent aminotransferase [Elusimicrobiota bacterium]|nr:pyridoxal phosphate-dependent aminotransferase [Elusimicrobiota bacterium]